MSLLVGTRLGPYEILAPLGSGGMGEVYRARDDRLGREVALKVLPGELSADSGRLKRFEKEARAASALNHPTIVTIYDIGVADSISYIAMELVDGKTLRETLPQAAPLPVRKLLGFATQIADGLGKAHTSGIVHRDLKPENVMVTKDGLVKILDFGLAKLVHPEQSGGQPTEAPTVSQGTTPGVVMGTVAYMSPEQASGRAVDFRSDQFSFGSMLYEMAAGKQAFRRATAAQTMAAIIQEEPESLATINPKMPPPLRWIVDQCLAKDPKDRYTSTEDLARDLVRIRDHITEISGSGETAAIPTRRRSRWFWLLPVAVATLFAVVLAARYLRRAPLPSSPIRSSLILPEKMSVHKLALSPDGRRLAFTAEPGTAKTDGILWIRTLETAEVQRITVGVNANSPFWSPDSRFVAFFSDEKLKKVDAAGKTIQTICDAERGAGGTWGPDGTIVFAPGHTSTLYRVSASGGRPVAVTKLDTSRHETSHRYPFFLPDGRHFLYSAMDLASEPEDPPNSIRIASLDGKLDKALVPTRSSAAYASGYLLYAPENTLFARPFDSRRLEATGDPVPIASDIWQWCVTGRLLVLATFVPRPSTLLWMDRLGKPSGTVGEPGFFNSPRLSPDGRRVAVDVDDPDRNARDIWIYDAATGIRTKLALNSLEFKEPSRPVWSPEGDRIVFSSRRKGKGTSTTLFVKPINGASEEALLEVPHDMWPDDWSSDGRFVSFGAIGVDGKRNFQLWILGMAGERKASPFTTEAGIQEDSRLSPDGRWIAYSSDESGKFEIYVRPFPSPGGKWLVSTAGGQEPRWRRDGKELFYLSLDNKIMSVPVRLDPTFQAGSPSALFSLPSSAYDVSADGQRFLVNKASGEEGSPPLTLLTDWTALIKE